MGTGMNSRAIQGDLYGLARQNTLEGLMNNLSIGGSARRGSEWEQIGNGYNIANVQNRFNGNGWQISNASDGYNQFGSDVFGRYGNLYQQSSFANVLGTNQFGGDAMQIGPWNWAGFDQAGANGDLYQEGLLNGAYTVNNFNGEATQYGLLNDFSVYGDFDGSYYGESTGLNNFYTGGNFQNNGQASLIGPSNVFGIGGNLLQNLHQTGGSRNEAALNLAGIYGNVDGNLIQDGINPDYYNLQKLNASGIWGNLNGNATLGGENMVNLFGVGGDISGNARLGGTGNLNLGYVGGNLGGNLRFSGNDNLNLLSVGGNVPQATLNGSNNLHWLSAGSIDQLNARGNGNIGSVWSTDDIFNTTISGNGNTYDISTGGALRDVQLNAQNSNVSLTEYNVWPGTQDSNAYLYGNNNTVAYNSYGNTNNNYYLGDNQYTQINDAGGDNAYYVQDATGTIYINDAGGAGVLHADGLRTFTRSDGTVIAWSPIGNQGPMTFVRATGVTLNQ
ncbi:MAG: hypothetical protein SFZ03_02650 [Candidatus Melainabacteria bacterium]|nr:hypothetical protein [Candidatus Melainabacteria bacterium]